MITKEIEDAFFNNYLEFFKKAESRRRWNIWNDIPWEKANKTAGDDIAEIVEFFSSVEMFLPDYTAKILHLVRKSRGRAWFQANWGYEESKHSLALAEWLVRSGCRAEGDLRNYENSLLENGEWELPYDHPCSVVIYTMIQERATQLNYTNLRKLAAARGDELLACVLKLIAADEAAHYAFFRDCVKMLLRVNKREMLDRLAAVFQTFKMPGLSLIPGSDKKGSLVYELNIYSPMDFYRNVYQPVLYDLELSVDELKYLKAPGALLDKAARRDEQKSSVKPSFSFPEPVGKTRMP